MKMNTAQREKLTLLCERFNVDFRESDYLVSPFGMTGWVEGWLGGKPGTLYVGVSPEGESHS